MDCPYRAVFLALLPALGCGGEETVAGTGCMEVEDGADACPEPASVDPEALWAGCGASVTAITGDGELEEISGATGGGYAYYDTADPGGVTSVCCYPVEHTPISCDVGRPIVIDGAARRAPVLAARWVDTPEDIAAPAHLRQLLADRWARTAADEHASVAAFARVTIDLLALGAPPDLLTDTQAAAADEVRHARLAFALASAFAGRPLGPGPLSIGALAPRTAEELAVATVRESCVGETVAALLAAEAGARAVPVVRAVLERVTQDEARHAALGWRTLRWLLARSPEVRPSVVAELGAVSLRITGNVAPDAFAADVAPYGLLSRAEAERVGRRALAEVVLPAARLLLEASV